MRWLVAIVVIGCGSPGVPPAAPSSAPSSPSAREATIALPGGANALWWDAGAATLYLTDSNTSAVVTWTDKSGLAPAGALPASESGVSLGGIVRRGDGSLVIANFGFGTHGGL